jgi:hypothetical protein
MPGTINLTSNGTTALNLSSFATLDWGDSTPRAVAFPIYAPDPKLVFHSTYEYENDASNIPQGISEFSYWDLDSISPGTPQTKDINLASFPGTLAVTAEGGANLILGIGGGSFFVPEQLSAHGTPTSYPLQGFSFQENDTISPIFNAALYQAPTGTLVLGAPQGTPFNFSGSIYFSVDPDGVQVTDGQGYDTVQLLSGLRSNAGTSYFRGAQFISLYDSVSGATITVAPNFNDTGQTLAEVTVDGSSVGVFQLLLPGDEAPTALGVCNAGFYCFDSAGHLIVYALGLGEALGTGTCTYYTLSPQDTVATACLSNFGTSGPFGGLTQLSTGEFVLTTAGTVYESVAATTNNPVLAAITSMGTDTISPSMSLTLTSISGTHGTALDLGGSYTYADTVAPTALDIGYLQSDGGTLWVPAASSTIGTTTPTGGFTTLGGTIA